MTRVLSSVTPHPIYSRFEPFFISCLQSGADQVERIVVLARYKLRWICAALVAVPVEQSDFHVDDAGQNGTRLLAGTKSKDVVSCVPLCRG